MNNIEWFGTAMSVIVLLSLTQKNIKWLRILNFIGAAGFSLYGFLIKAWPVAGLNGFIAVIDLWYLGEMLLKKDQFSHFFCDPAEDSYCCQFMKYYRDDILKYQPGLPDSFNTDNKGCIILRNMIPVSLIIFKMKTDHTVEILVDYATPTFRDFKNGKYFLSRVVHKEEMSSVSELITTSGSKKHETYLKRMGYKKTGDNPDSPWILKV